MMSVIWKKIAKAYWYRINRCVLNDDAKENIRLRREIAQVNLRYYKQKHLAELGQAAQWISVDDRLPEDGQRVDIWAVNKEFPDDSFRCTDIKYDKKYGFETPFADFIEPDGSDTFMITHWMKIPEAPGKENCDG